MLQELSVCSSDAILIAEEHLSFRIALPEKARCYSIVDGEPLLFDRELAAGSVVSKRIVRKVPATTTKKESSGGYFLRLLLIFCAVVILVLGGWQVMSQIQIGDLRSALTDSELRLVDMEGLIRQKDSELQTLEKDKVLNASQREQLARELEEKKGELSRMVSQIQAYEQDMDSASRESAMQLRELQKYIAESEPAIHSLLEFLEGQRFDKVHPLRRLLESVSSDE